MKYIKGGGILLLIVLLTGYLFYTQMTYNTRAIPTCHTVIFQFTDAGASHSEHPFLDKQQLINLLNKRGLWPVGKSGENLRMDSIEQILRTHDLVRSVECYLTGSNGQMVIHLERRMPIVCVQNADGHLYMDAEKVAFKVSGQPVTASPLPIVIATHLRQTDTTHLHSILHPIVRYLVQTPKTNIVQFTYAKDSSLAIRMQGDSTIYDLGQIEQSDDIVYRLNKLSSLLDYRKQSGIPDSLPLPYSRVYLGFEGQIVCDTLHITNL